MRTWTALSGLLAAAALSACDIVDDHAPTFSPSQAVSPLKPGLWQTPTGCETARPLPRSTFCVPHGDGLSALQWVITPKALFGAHRGDTPDLPAGMPYVISPGAPMLMQIQADVPDKPDKSPGLRAGLHVWFLALEPTSRDAAGRITAFTVWPVMCGPTPHAGSPNFDETDVTKHPFAGLAMDGMTCTARDAASIRAAALASRSVFADNTMSYEWAGNAPVN